MKKHYKGLAAAMAEDQIVKIYRKHIDEHRLEGYVVGLSDKWVLLHDIDGNALVLDGYKAVRLADISESKVDNSFVGEYFRRRGIRPQKQAQIQVEDLSALLMTASRHYAMFMIECERVEPGIGFIGVIETLTKRKLWMKKFSSDAKWIETEKFRLKDITSINFGGGYVEALVWMDARDKAVAAEEEAAGQ